MLQRKFCVMQCGHIKTCRTAFGIVMNFFEWHLAQLANFNSSFLLRQRSQLASKKIPMTTMVAMKAPNNADPKLCPKPNLRVITLIGIETVATRHPVRESWC